VLDRSAPLYLRMDDLVDLAQPEREVRCHLPHDRRSIRSGTHHAGLGVW
jgi:hypothetical protein